MRPEDETWADIEKMVYLLCHRAHRQWGLPFDDLLSAAGEAYAVAYQSYNPDLAAFTTHVWNKVRGGLLRAFREFKKDAKLVRDLDLSLFAKRPAPAFSLDKFSEDAKTLVLACFDPPEGVLGPLRALGVTPETVRAAIRSYLLTDLGWPYSRVRKAFMEVKGAI